MNEVKPDSDSSARWWSDPTMLVTNGPYTAETLTGSTLTLTENANYGKKITGPDELVLHFSDEQTGQILYAQELVDAVWPLSEEEMAARITADETWQADPVLETYSVLFNWSRLEEDGIRRALSLAIDRDAIAALAGITGKPAAGLVPPGRAGGGAGLPHQRRRFDRQDLRGLCRPLHAGGAAHAGGRL